MTDKEILKIFVEKKALLEGHFLLSSGLHSEKYLQCAKLLQYPDLATQLGAELAAKLRPQSPQLVVGPALGGIFVSFEVARALGVRSVFTERSEGQFELRRGFEIGPGERVLIVEDVVTTGKSTLEVVEVARKLGAQIVGVGCLVDRSGGQADFGVPFASLLKVSVTTYPAADCPLCRKGIPLVKPGSRKVPDAGAEAPGKKKSKE